MPSAEHETPIALANLDPAFVAGLLTDLFGVKLPEIRRACTRPTEVREMAPHTYHIDTVLRYSDQDDEPLLAIVLEVQREYVEEKWVMWKRYAVHIEAEEGVKVGVVVFCPKPGVADSYHAMNEGDDWLSVPLRPFIFSPDEVPLITDLGTARRQPALAIFAALCHRRHRHHPKADQLYEILTEALRAVGTGLVGVSYYDAVLVGLPEEDRAGWETHMTTTTNQQYRSELLRTTEARGEAAGEVRGEAHALLTVLDVRGVDVPDEVRDDMLACTDLAQIQTWLQRAATAETIQDVIRT